MYVQRSTEPGNRSAIEIDGYEKNKNHCMYRMHREQSGLYRKMLYGEFYRNGNIAFPTRLSKLVMEKLPDILKRFDTVIGIKQIQPSRPLQLQDMPRLLIRVRGVTAVAVGQDIKVASVDAKMENGDMVVDGRDHVNLYR